MNQLLPPLAAALVALLPAFATFWWGRAAAGSTADPVRPERLAAARRRTGVVFGLSTALLLTTAIHDCIWALPLLAIARMTAGYYVRRTLFAETWSLFAYFSFFVRLIVASFGFWILLAAAPAIVDAWPAHSWVAAALLAAAAVLWSAHYGDAFRVVLRAQEIPQSDVQARFRALAEACGLPRVWFGEVDPRGGMVANAVALPSVKRPAVVFSKPLLDALTPEEAVGICAHEIAHLEHFNPRRLRRMAAGTYALIAAGALLVPVLQLMLPPLVPYVWFIWLPLLVVSLALRARDRQQNETASDLRALALTGNPEALISALIKLHTMVHLARRWDPEVERRASHPSLARRIQAIRGAAGTPPPPLAESTQLADPNGQSSVAFHAERMQWVEGESMAHTVAYSHLSELRIVATGAGVPRLRATTKSGQRWEMTLAPADAARAQAALDLIDSRLGTATHTAAATGSLAKFAAIAALATAVFLMHTAVMLTSFLALVQPSTQLITAAGAASVAAALLMWFSPAHDVAFVLLLLACGMTLFAAAYANRRDPVPDKQNRAIAALGAATALAWLLLFTQGGGAWQLHQAASLWPAATIFPAAAAAALAFAESRRVRAATVPLGVAALVLAFVASPQFVDAFVRDSFITPGRPPELRLTTIDDRPSKQVSLAFVPMDIRISPSGEYMAALTEDDTEVTTVRVGRADGALAIFQADDAIFVGDDRVLLLQRGAGGSVVRVVSLRDGVKDERAPVALDGFQAARVSVSLSGDRWVALGSGADRSLMTLTGRFDGSTPTERQWAADGGYSNSIVAASDDRVLLLQTRYRPNILARSGFYQWAFLLGPYSTESQLSMVDAQGVRTPVAASELSVTCDGRGGLAETTCAAYDGACTRILGFDSVTATFKPLAIFKGHLFTRHVSADGWIAGWWGGSAVAIHPRSYEAVRVGSGFAAYAIAASGRAIAAASVSGSGSLIQIFTHSEASARR